MAILFVLPTSTVRRRISAQDECCLFDTTVQNLHSTIAIIGINRKRELFLVVYVFYGTNVGLG